MEAASNVPTSEDIVSHLLYAPFSWLHFNELIGKGRPTPELKFVQKTKAFERHFNSSKYTRYTWMTGSTKDQKLHCWELGLFAVWRGEWVLVQRWIF